MSDQFPLEDNETLTPQEVRQWAAQEIASSAKASELRIKEANDVADKYASGEISSEQAMERLVSYDKRWGEALYGVATTAGVTDEQILARIDSARDNKEKLFSKKGARRQR